MSDYQRTLQGLGGGSSHSKPIEILDFCFSCLNGNGPRGAPLSRVLVFNKYFDAASPAMQSEFLTGKHLPVVTVTTRRAGVLLEIVTLHSVVITSIQDCGLLEGRPTQHVVLSFAKVEIWQSTQAGGSAAPSPATGGVVTALTSVAPAMVSRRPILGLSPALRLTR